MIRNFVHFALLGPFVLSFAVSTRAQLTPELLAQLPPASPAPVDFVRDIKPIFEASCVQCHARGKAKGAFSLETFDDFLFGGDSGAPAVAGRSAESLVVEMISGLNPDIIMPQKGTRLTTEQVSVFRAWIDQGMAWPEEITFFKREPANLHPRAPDLLPSRPGLENPVDRIVDAYFTDHGFTWPGVVDDRTYARRVWLDTIGLLPPPGELEAFLADSTAGKRERLVQRLLDDRQGYAEHWLTFWNDLLRNDYRGAGFIDGGRKQITSWLYTALARNLPYDQFVAELLNPGAAAEGFTNGILWRGAVNASMVPPMQAAQGISQVFLGVNLKCASCHDSFIDEYTLDDAYGLASIYADGPLEIAECDKLTGQVAKVKFLYEDLGSIDARADPAGRKQQLVEIITGEKNGRLPRTIVNRLWQRFMGHGLVEPVDEMDKPAWSPDLIDWLAEDLVAHRFDLKHTLARILTSRAYQLPSINVAEVEENYVFRGPAVRRLSAEQFSDALLVLTQATHERSRARVNRHAALRPADERLPLEPKWIWRSADGYVKAPPATLVFRRSFLLPEAPTAAHFAIAADDNYTIRINGKAAGSSGRRNSTYPDWIDVRRHLQTGENVVEITVSNMPPDEGRLVSVRDDVLPEADSPAGLIVYAKVRVGNERHDFVTDSSWTVAATPRPPVMDRFDTQGQGEPQVIGTATEMGDVTLAPWKLGSTFLDLAAAPEDTLPVTRASLALADPLMISLGRPNREQVMTVRQTTATTLQALELTNGSTLAAALKTGAETLVGTRPAAADSRALVDSLFRQSINRAPSEAETRIAMQMVGSPANREGIEDLLWVLAMLPEFQLIY